MCFVQYKPIKTAYVITIDVTAHAHTHQFIDAGPFIHSYVVHFRIRRTRLILFSFFGVVSPFFSPHSVFLIFSLFIFVDFTDNVWSCTLGIASENNRFSLVILFHTHTYTYKTKPRAYSSTIEKKKGNNNNNLYGSAYKPILLSPPKPKTKNQEPKKQREGKGKKNYKKKENRIAEGLIISFL